MQDPRTSRWYPIAASSDLPFRHTFHGQLLGREFAVWRADDGYVNVWENRCLHRGVRLSIGINDGRELKCQYHGWRYANRTAGCTYIPAHPADSPARTICNRTYPSIERYGLVWSGEEPEGELPSIAELEDKTCIPLRAMPINAPTTLVAERLQTYTFQPNDCIDNDSGKTTVRGAKDDCIHLSSSDGSTTTSAIFFIQPVDSNRSVVRGVLDAEPNAANKLYVLKYHNYLLSKLRDECETEASSFPSPAPMQPDIKPQNDESEIVFHETSSGRRAELRVQVSRKWLTAEDIAGFELKPLTGSLPTFQPGAHIDVHMPNGLVRQYSLTNGPGEAHSYGIGVKREPDSNGGSQCMHEQIREGDVLAISAPRNNFPLRRDAVKTIFVAGGIGITPLLSMARALKHTDLSFDLHYFAQSEHHLAFTEVLSTFGEALHTHLALNPEQTGDELKRVLSGYQQASQLYVCGPGPMLESTRYIASESGWPDESIHFEYFKNTK